jgi:inward rectifier potassium channel
VHPIDEASPFFGRGKKDLEQKQDEVIILIKGFDETFSQTVHARYSYRFDEIAWNAKFIPAFEFDETGNMVLNINKVGNYTVLEP